MKKNNLKEKMIKSGNITPETTENKTSNVTYEYEILAKSIVNGINETINEGLAKLNETSSQICNDIINGAITNKHELESRTDVITIIASDVLGEFVTEENLYKEVIQTVEDAILRDYYVMLHNHVGNNKVNITEKIERYENAPYDEFSQRHTKSKTK